ncbi:actin-related protein ARPC3 [Armillaria luteobubalina]|uniref:Arp2/3 complex 41 kDa subunit n=1 Tax=Armillaria luteobubalina TaxID=153913 RepID=A0AA39Q8H8_9AGAR|nr:actin-related protein ARPC3 [Armillaria luteobubalina]
MAPEIFSLGQTAISAHAFNADRTQVAASLNSNEAQIFSRRGSEWIATEILAEHDKVITSIDWAPSSNRIVTASQDRNAYVWQPSPDGSWKPTLVLLRINRAATYVRWSPNEDKFAVASGARAIAVCHFDPENNWWVSKLLKKPIRSTVLSVDWHPNNDSKARVFSAYIKEVDAKPPPTVWGSKLPFNTICGEYPSPAGGWVHSVAFSPSGDVLAFASHDSSITVVYPAGGIHNVKMTSLPVVTLTWTAEDCIVAAGHDCQPFVFSGSAETGWQGVGTLDDTSAVPKSAARPGVGGPGRLKPYESAGGGLVTWVSTSGADGNLVIWDVNEVTALTGKMGGLSMR